MKPLPPELNEQQVQQLARHLVYPPTPDLAKTLAGQPRLRPGQTRWLAPAWALLLLLVCLLIGLVSVLPVRAALCHFWQIGVVNIWLAEPTPTPVATPQPTPSDQVSPTELAGATSLAAAQAQISFPIRLPSFPADLGKPDQVYLQDLDGTTVILVWLEEAQPGRVRLSLHQLTSGVVAWKTGVQRVAETTVNGQPAVWATGPYLLALRNGDWEFRRLVNGHVLIWEEAGITYRLESALSLAEAVQIAESLQPAASE